MFLEPFFRFLSAAQALSRTEPMPRWVSNASLASSQESSSSRLERMLELTPSDLVFVFSDFSGLEELVQLR